MLFKPKLILAITLPLIAGYLLGNQIFKTEPVFQPLALPYYSSQQTIVPFVTNSYDLGTTTKVWRDFFVTQICLSGDCKTAWPTVSGGGASTTLLSDINIFSGATTTLYGVNVGTTTPTQASAKLSVVDFSGALGADFGMLYTQSFDSSGGNYDLRMDSPQPDIEFIETDQAGAAGEYELGVNNDVFYVAGRKVTDDGFDQIAQFYRPEDGGRFVIGSTTPSVKFEIQDYSGSATANYMRFVNFQGSAGAAPGMAWFNSVGNYDSARLSSAGGASFANSNFRVQVADSAKALQERLLIDVNGNVGLSSSTPAKRLSVQGDGLFSGDLFTAGLTATGTINFSGLSAGGVGVNSLGNLYSYATTTWTFASSTLLSDTNMWSGANTYSAQVSIMNGNGNIVSGGGASAVGLLVQEAGGGTGGAINFANNTATIGVSSDGVYNGYDYDGAMVFRQTGTNPDSIGEFIFIEEDGNWRFALPTSGPGRATYNPRSMIIAGPATSTSGNFLCSSWGFNLIDCNTSLTGADMGVQDDLQVLGKGYFADLTATSTFSFSGFATSTFSGGIEAPRIGGSLLFATSTTATSTFAGGLSGAFGAFSNGLNVSGGRVGISSTTPATALSVEGIGYFDDQLGVGSYNSAIRAVIGNTASQNTLQVLGVSTSNMSPVLSLRRSGSVEWTLGAGGTLTSDFVISANPANYQDATLASGGKFVIKSATGNVGISTSSPYARLSVAGEIVGSHFTATTTATSTLPYLNFTQGQGTGLSLSNISATGAVSLANATVQIKQYPAFSYATSTAWSATSTQPLGVAAVAETWTKAQCFTDAGTVDVFFTDGTNRMNWFRASTTVGTITLTQNNQFTVGEKRYFEAGNPLSSPYKLSCTITKIVNQ